MYPQSYELKDFFNDVVDVLERLEIPYLGSTPFLRPKRRLCHQSLLLCLTDLTVGGPTGLARFPLPRPGEITSPLSPTGSDSYPGYSLHLRFALYTKGGMGQSLEACRINLLPTTFTYSIDPLLRQTKGLLDRFQFVFQRPYQSQGLLPLVEVRIGLLGIGIHFTPQIFPEMIQFSQRLCALLLELSLFLFCNLFSCSHIIPPVDDIANQTYITKKGHGTIGIIMRALVQVNNHIYHIFGHGVKGAKQLSGARKVIFYQINILFTIFLIFSRFFN